MATVRRGDRRYLLVAEQRLAIFLGHEREKNATAAGINDGFNKRMGNASVEPNIMGMGGEIAFAHWMNVYPDLSSHASVGGLDHVLHNGIRVDAKTTPYFDRPLLVVDPGKAQQFDVDIYVCIACQWPLFTFIGWAPRARVFARTRDIGHGTCYVLEPSELEDCLVDEGSAVTVR